MRFYQGKFNQQNNDQREFTAEGFGAIKSPCTPFPHANRGTFICWIGVSRGEGITTPLVSIAAEVITEDINLKKWREILLEIPVIVNNVSCPIAVRCLV